MDCVKIKKVGKENTVYNVVSEEQFERVYKPCGWVIDREPIEVTDFEVKTTDETIIKNLEKAKKVTNKNFDDKLIKEK